MGWGVWWQRSLEGGSRACSDNGMLVFILHRGHKIRFAGCGEGNQVAARVAAEDKLGLSAGEG